MMITTIPGNVNMSATLKGKKMDNRNLNSYWFGHIEALVAGIDYIALNKTLTVEEAEKAMLSLANIASKCEALKKNIEGNL